MVGDKATWWETEGHGGRQWGATGDSGALQETEGCCRRQRDVAGDRGSIVLITDVDKHTTIHQQDKEIVCHSVGLQV